jgi:twitching motility two-component system response regulator PilH
MTKTVLVVDDVVTERKHLRKILEAEGHRVVEAGDGEEAFTVAEAQMPDLILMDIVMPKPGFAATRRLKKNPKTSKIPVCMVTSINRETDKENAAENGAVAYLVKPATQASLVAVLKKVFTD